MFVSFCLFLTKIFVCFGNKEYFAISNKIVVYFYRLIQLQKQNEVKKVDMEFELFGKS